MPTEMPFAGPFRGLNTTQRPRELSPDWATEARNVIYSEGQIRPRAPWVDYLQGVLEDWREDATALAIVSIFPVLDEGTAPEQPESRRTLFKTRPVDLTVKNKGELWSIVQEERGPRLIQLAENLSNRPADFAVFNNLIYVVDGSGWVGRTDGVTLELAGIPGGQSYPKVHLGGGNSQFSGLEAARYQYAWSWYNADLDLEGNYHETTELDGSAFGELGVRILIYRQFLGSDTLIPTPPQRGITHWRLYRKNLSKGETYFWLIETLPLHQTLFHDYETDLVASQPKIPEGTPTSGPYGAVKNGLPELWHFSTLFPYRGRMFYGRQAGVGLAGQRHDLMFSAIDHPDYVDEGDYLPLELDERNQGVTGLAVLSGQLAILQPGAMHIHAGDIITTTNDSIATALLPAASSHTVYKTSAVAGCENRAGGNGAIVCGHPPLLYYNAASGLYVNNGVDERMVTPHIKPTWRRFAEGRYGAVDQQAVSYAVDTLNEILYLANAEASGVGPAGDVVQPSTEAESFILAYHYARRGQDGVGVWSMIDADQTAAVSCVASALGTPILEAGGRPEGDEPQRYVQLLAGTTGGQIYESDDREASELPMPHFLHKTGRARIKEGQLVHSYFLKWLHDQAAAGTLLRVGAIFDGKSDLEEVTIDVGASIYSRQPLRRVSTDAQLVVRNADPPGVWSPQVSVVGWVFVGELAGERS